MKVVHAWGSDVGGGFKCVHPTLGEGAFEANELILAKHMTKARLSGLKRLAELRTQVDKLTIKLFGGTEAK